jgi:hypothetical protein
MSPTFVTIRFTKLRFERVGDFLVGFAERYVVWNRCGVFGPRPCAPEAAAFHDLQPPELRRVREHFAQRLYVHSRRPR